MVSARSCPTPRPRGAASRKPRARVSSSPKPFEKPARPVSRRAKSSSSSGGCCRKKDNAMHALEIRGLQKTFPRFRLGPIDLTVPRGTIYGFVGPNGAGKTTTIDLIFGMGAKDDGSIHVLGLD